jgi:hypothetical protein
MGESPFCHFCQKKVRLRIANGLTSPVRVWSEPIKGDPRVCKDRVERLESRVARPRSAPSHCVSQPPYIVGITKLGDRLSA